MIFVLGWKKSPVIERLPPTVRWGSEATWRPAFCFRRDFRRQTSAAAIRPSNSFNRLPSDWLDIHDSHPGISGRKHLNRHDNRSIRRLAMGESGLVAAVSILGRLGLGVGLLWANHRDRRRPSNASASSQGSVFWK